MAPSKRGVRRAAPAHAAHAERRDFTLPNGLKVVAVRRGTVPIAAVRLVVLAGSCLDPRGKSGLADFTARLLRRGTRTRSADELDEAVEFAGASLSPSAAEDDLALSVSTPVDALPGLLDVLSELVREPAFLASELESEKERALAQFANDLDDPGLLADRALVRTLWGDRHPYGHDVEGSRREVESFTREDVVRFHQERIGPRVSTLYVVAPVDPDQVHALARAAFSSWSGGPDEPTWPSGAEIAEPGRVVIVDKPEQTQSQVRLAGLAYAKASPDFFPGVVLNAVLGSGFASRLVNEIRVNRGLSYGANSHFESLKLGGSLELSTFTKTETTGEIIRVALNEVRKLRERGLRKGELKTAVTYVSGLYPLRTESNESLSTVLSNMDIYGLGRDWVERYRDRVEAVTVQQVMAVARRYLFGTRPPTLVVVGHAAKVAPQLKGFPRPVVLKAQEA